MSTDSVRTLVQKSIKGVMKKAKGQIKEQGKKQVIKLKQKIPTPAEIKEKLMAEITGDSCTGAGKIKFENKLKQITDKIDSIKSAIDGALDKLTGVDEKISKIIDPSGVLAKIKKLADILTPIITALAILVLIVKILAKTIGMIPPPFTAPSGPIFIASAIADIAHGTVTEFGALILSLALIVNLYHSKITKMLNIIKIAIAKLQSLKDMIDRLAAFILAIKLDFESGCEDLLNEELEMDDGKGDSTGDSSTGDSTLATDEFPLESTGTGDGIGDGTGTGGDGTGGDGTGGDGTGGDGTGGDGTGGDGTDGTNTGGSYGIGGTGGIYNIGSGTGTGGTGDTGGIGDTGYNTGGNTGGTGDLGGDSGTGTIGGNNNGNNVSSLNDSMSLEDLIKYSEKRYGDMLFKLLSLGDNRALQRIEILQKETKEWVSKYNISFKIINI